MSLLDLEGGPKPTEYLDGFSHGVRWAEQDIADGLGMTHEELERLREEAQGARWQRTFYLGALRGYRSIVRTQDTKGRWRT